MFARMLAVAIQAGVFESIGRGKGCIASALSTTSSNGVCGQHVQSEPAVKQSQLELMRALIAQAAASVTFFGQ